MRIVSGMRPTGKLHLGHYFGVIKNWLKLQQEHDCFFFIADWHALTNKYKDTSDLKDNIRQLMIDWLSTGIDPEKSTLFIQSGVKEHAELALLFGMFTPKSWLELNPTYKDMKFNLFYQYIRDFLYGKQIKVNEDLLREIFHHAFYHKREIDFKYLKNELLKLGIKEEYINHIIKNISEGDIGKEIDTYGFFGYPILQAADILIYKAQGVPVGEDQLPHIEITREIARRFNNLYTHIFPEPEAILTETPKLVGLDGRKMSKSYNNAIYLSDDTDTVNQKVKTMKTDPNRVRRTDPGNPEICPVFINHKLFTDEETIKRIDIECRTAQIGCVDCKKILSDNINRFLNPIREKRKQIEQNIKEYEEIFINGTKKAREIANDTMKEVRESMNLYDI